MLRVSIRLEKRTVRSVFATFANVFEGFFWVGFLPKLMGKSKPSILLSRSLDSRQGVSLDLCFSLSNVQAPKLVRGVGLTRLQCVAGMYDLLIAAIAQANPPVPGSRISSSLGLTRYPTRSSRIRLHTHHPSYVWC